MRCKVRWLLSIGTGGRHPLGVLLSEMGLVGALTALALGLLLPSSSALPLASGGAISTRSPPDPRPISPRQWHPAACAASVLPLPPSPPHRRRYHSLHSWPLALGCNPNPDPNPNPNPNPNPSPSPDPNPNPNQACGSSR